MKQNVKTEGINLTHLVNITEWVIYKTCARTASVKLVKEKYWSVSNYVIFVTRKSFFSVVTIIVPLSSTLIL